MAAGINTYLGVVRIATVAGPALVVALAAALGMMGWALTGVALVSALLALVFASLGGERVAEDDPTEALGALGEAAGVGPPPREGSGTPASRWVLGAAERVAALRAEVVTRRAVIDATDAPIFATSGVGAILACNRAACEFLGRSAEEILGKELGDLFSHAELLALNDAARDGQARRGQVRLLIDGASRIYQALAVPVAPLASGGSAVGRGGAGFEPPVVVLTLRDVTELAQAAQLKTDFVANASHELRTPLSSIRGAVETLAELGDEDPEMRARLIQMIAGNAERLEDLTRDLLDLSRLESPDAPSELGPVDLVEIARSVVAQLESIAARRGVTIETAIDPPAAALYTDRRLLTVILRNLVENAVKFAYEGTAVRIVAEAVGEERSAEDDTARRAVPPKTLHLRVIDRGIGIPLAQQSRIFERFFQGDPARTGDSQARGTGLGLAIVKHAVRTLGGAISVESVWKEGTAMTVEVPGCVVES